ncbi:MAG: hypothetical protein U5P41_13180 [Gammaproteobacteria bacterium]|nr:hypothetical protein [Gammaproteobacteria bacterium]
MSLRTRLNLLITLCLGLILLLGTLFVIQQARNAVQEEVSSTANLSLRLIEIALSNTSGEDAAGLQQKVIGQLARLRGDTTLAYRDSQTGHARSRHPGPDAQP